jgi:hypothetical protein
VNFPDVLLQGIVWFRKSFFFRIFYVSILSLMVAAITLYGFYLGCLSILFAGIVMLALPYWLKERNMRTLALNGVVVFLIATLIFGALFAQTLSGNDPVPVASEFSGGAILSNATVTPGRGPPGASYNFTANLTVPGGVDASMYAVFLNLTTIDGTESPVSMAAVDPLDTDLSDGKRYYAYLSVGDRIYLFWFAVRIENGSAFSWFESPWQIGPITAGYGTFFGFSLYYGALALILPVSFYFIVLMLYWWTQRAKAERRRLGMAVETASTDSGFMCTNCGADVPAEAKNCPKCGAAFEEVPPSAPAGGTAGVGEGPDAKP